MKKFLCCLLALITLGAGTATAVSCGGNSDVGGTSSGGVSSSAPPIINENSVTLRFPTKLYNLEVGQTAALDIEFTADGVALDTGLLTFTSDAPDVATVSADGVVTGVAAGKATITMSYGKSVAKATVKVAKSGAWMEISEQSALLLVGDEKQVTVKTHFGLTEVTDATLSWQSSAPDVATVENGVITAVGKGKANITVSYENATETIAVTVVTAATAAQVNTFSEEYLNIYGRTYITSGELNLDHAANGVEIGVIGTSLSVELSSTAKSKMRVFVDGDKTGEKIDLSAGTKTYTVASGLSEGYHTVRIVKATEESLARWDILSFAADGFFAMPDKPDLKIEFIGSSAATGYGIYGGYGQEGSVDNSDCSKSYAYLAAHELNVDYSIVAMTGVGAAVKFWSPESMDTLYQQVSSTNVSNYTFDFNPDIIVLNIGSVESSYITRLHDGDPSYAPKFSPDYQRLLSIVREKNPNAFIICLYGMINDTPTIHSGIRLAIENLGDERIVYNPFEIEQNNYGAINHPNSVAQKQWSEDLVAYIRSLDI